MLRRSLRSKYRNKQVEVQKALMMKKALEKAQRVRHELAEMRDMFQTAVFLDV